MDKKNGTNETLVPLTHPSLIPIKKLACKLKKLSSIEKIDFVKNIKKSEIVLIIELAYNYIKGNIVSDFRLHNNLKKNKKVLYDLISKSKKNLCKKIILGSVKGIYVLSILVNLFSKTCKEGK